MEFILTLTKKLNYLISNELQILFFTKLLYTYNKNKFKNKIQYKKIFF